MRATVERLAAHELRGLARSAEGQQDLAVQRALANRVIPVVGQEHGSVGRHVQTVRARKQTLTPGTQEIALAVEYHHRMVAAVEDVNIVLFVNADRPDLAHDHAGGNARPVIELFKTVVTLTNCNGHSVPLVAVPAS